MKVTIIGGGLAGCALAYVLKQAGMEPVIHETGMSLAAGASGNKAGLYNPRLSAERHAQSDYYSAAFAEAIRTFEILSGIEWNRCGALHLMSDEKRATRYAQTVKNWDWPQEHMRLVSRDEASAIAGVALAHDALWLPDSGSVSPEKLCAAYARGVEVKLNAKITALDEFHEEIVVFACGMGVKNFTQTRHIPVNAVRGQVTYVKPNAESAGLKTNLCYGGYFSPALNGEHMLGATFQRWLDHDSIIMEDDADNIAGLKQVAPALAENLEVMGHRAAVRTASKDHFPIVGRVKGQEKLYVSTGHGSHGILSTLAAAHIIRDMILEKDSALFTKVMHNALCPGRFEMVKPSA
jgi:tRNA 5-methylaminomethyl-2-thiouridine biosynthesis bifunctional protein